jgi:hypothetical protein
LKSKDACIEKEKWLVEKIDSHLKKM